MWELDYKESWAQKNWCFWTVVLEKTLESPLDSKEIQPVHPKGDQSWVFIGRTDVEAETQILWPPHGKSWLIWKDPDAGKDWGQKEKGMTEDEMVRWHHRLNRYGFGWTLGVGDGQGGLACCGSWGRKESNTTEQLNWTDPVLIFLDCSTPVRLEINSASRWATADIPLSVFSQLAAPLFIQWPMTESQQEIMNSVLDLSSLHCLWDIQEEIPKGHMFN